MHFVSNPIAYPMGTVYIFFTFLSLYTAISTTVNSQETWLYGHNERFANMTLEQLQLVLGSRRSKVPVNILVEEPNFGIGGPPDNFDSRDLWPKCSGSISTIRDQSSCGSCWATASSSVMSDMTCIQCDGQYSPYISDEDLLGCCGSQCGDCSGGDIGLAFEYWIKTGIVTGGNYHSGRGCKPFSIPPQKYLHGKHPATPTCQRACQDGYPIDYWQDLRKGNLSRWVTGAYFMQHRVWTSGPIVTMFDVYESFMRGYRGGVYSCPSNQKPIGFHAAKVIGWGMENDVPYWLAVNSWGVSWGEKGFFKIRRGQNDCDFERAAVWAVASENACFNTANNFTSPNGQSRTRGDWWSLEYFLLIFVISLSHSQCLK